MAFELQPKHRPAVGSHRTISYSLARTSGALYLGKYWLEETKNAGQKYAVFYFDVDAKLVAFKFVPEPVANAFSCKADGTFGTMQIKNKNFARRMKEYGYPPRTNLPYKEQDGMIVLLKPE